MRRLVTGALIAIALGCATRSYVRPFGLTVVVVNDNYYANRVRIFCSSGALAGTLHLMRREQNKLLALRCQDVRIRVEGLGDRSWTSDPIPVNPGDTLAIYVPSTRLRYTHWLLRR